MAGSGNLARNSWKKKRLFYSQWYKFYIFLISEGKKHYEQGVSSRTHSSLQQLPQASTWCYLRANTDRMWCSWKSQTGESGTIQYTDAGSTPQCGKGFFCSNQFSVQTLMVLTWPLCATTCTNICMHLKNPKHWHWQPCHCLDQHTRILHSLVELLLRLL